VKIYRKKPPDNDDLVHLNLVLLSREPTLDSISKTFQQKLTLISVLNQWLLLASKPIREHYGALRLQGLKEVFPEFISLYNVALDLLCPII